MTGFIGIDFHSKRLKNFFTKKTKVYHLSVFPLIVRYLKKNLKNTIVLPADKGASKSANFLAKELNIPIGSVDKTRINDTKVRIEKITVNVSGKDVIFFDDEISPVATTVITLGKELEKRKAKSLTVAVTHASIINKTIRKLKGIKILKEIIVTDTIPIPPEASESLPLRIISVAEILAETIREISKEKD
jgi:ribose-phosphate pyrophosphokinase